MKTILKFLAWSLTLAGLTVNLAQAADPAPPAPVPRSGQTLTAPLNPAPIGADGALEKGVAWPSPRFTDESDGTVTDALTGLVWLKNANCTDTVGGVNKGAATLKWSQALAWSNALASGKCGLTDGSVAGDWRLPNLRELHSLVDLSQTGPALPAGHPFLNGWSTLYWSSSTFALATGQAWNMNLNFGAPGRLGKSSRQGVWPVRDASSQPPPGLEIGDYIEGGIVFYIDDSGQHGLIAAPTDQSDGVKWYNLSLIVTGATDIDVGAGQANTSKIVAAQGPGNYAAALADNLVLNGRSDWFLPSYRELYLMYRNIGPGAPAPLTNIGGFSRAWYWSSSESSDEAKAGFFSGSNSAWGTRFKGYTYSVRAVRAF
jgi:hypothetical protein